VGDFAWAGGTDFLELERRHIAALHRARTSL